MSSPQPTGHAAFEHSGSITPLRKAADGYAPARQLGGWIITYGKIAPDGAVVPTLDREGHVFEAARTPNGVDFSRYLDLAKGVRGFWNDTHHFDGHCFVGVPTGLEHHTETTELAKAHGKVGWWTEGHLWDRGDERSWKDFTDYVPTPHDLDRADYYWNAAVMLKGLPRDLGMSAHGKMRVSECGHRITWASVDEDAICEMPQNPDATVQPLRLAVPRAHCADCDGCACGGSPLAKAVTAQSIVDVAPEDLEGGPRDGANATAHAARLDDVLVQRIVALYGSSEADARRWVARMRRLERAAQQRNAAQKRPTTDRSLHG